MAVPYEKDFREAMITYSGSKKVFNIWYADIEADSDGEITVNKKYWCRWNNKRVRVKFLGIVEGICSNFSLIMFHLSIFDTCVIVIVCYSVHPAAPISKVIPKLEKIKPQNKNLKIRKSNNHKKSK